MCSASMSDLSSGPVLTYERWDAATAASRVQSHGPFVRLRWVGFNRPQRATVPVHVEAGEVGPPPNASASERSRWVAAGTEPLRYGVRGSRSSIIPRSSRSLLSE
jgi:hypothetical protein